MRLLLALSILLASSAHADPLRVLCAGDSITVGYCNTLPGAFAANSVDATLQTPPQARGGMASRHFLGLAGWPGESPVDYRANVVALDPDVVVMTLGINDVFFDWLAPGCFTAYEANMTEAFGSIAGRRIVVLSLLPVNVAANQAYWGETWQSGVNSRVVDVNAWLEAEASARGLEFVDLWSSIQTVPGWESTLLGADGLHPTWAGNQWIAQQVAQAVPEPATGASLLAGVVVLASLLPRRLVHRGEQAGVGAVAVDPVVSAEVAFVVEHERVEQVASHHVRPVPDAGTAEPHDLPLPLRHEGAEAVDFLVLVAPLLSDARISLVPLVIQQRFRDVSASAAMLHVPSCL